MRAPPGGGGEDGRAPVATPAGPPVGEEGEEARGEDYFLLVSSSSSLGVVVMGDGKGGTIVGVVWRGVVWCVGLNLVENQLKTSERPKEKASTVIVVMSSGGGGG